MATYQSAFTGAQVDTGITKANSAQQPPAEGPFVDGDKTKLDGIEDGATADQTGAEIKIAYEAQANTNAFTDAEKSKLDGIEAGADVTDTANVTAAGALMDSEVDADIKTLSLPANTTISAFGASLVDDADAATARTTLGLGTAATTDSTDYATASQGALADTAVQPGDDADTLGSGDAADGYVLTADGVGGAAWEAASGGGGTPAGSSGQFQFNDGGIFAAADLWQATNVIEQRNSTNAQTFNIYNTYTDASNYERGFMKWNANEFQIGTEAAGAGTARQAVLFGKVKAASVPATLVEAEDDTSITYPTFNKIGFFAGGNDVFSVTSSGVDFAADTQVKWTSGSYISGVDSGISRVAPAQLRITNGSTGTGELIFIVPTSDPGITGALWNNAGTLSISA